MGLGAAAVAYQYAKGRPEQRAPERWYYPESAGPQAHEVLRQWSQAYGANERHRPPPIQVPAPTPITEFGVGPVYTSRPGMSEHVAGGNGDVPRVGAEYYHYGLRPFGPSVRDQLRELGAAEYPTYWGTLQ